MLIAAIPAAHGTRLTAARDPAERLQIAHDAVAHAPLPPLDLRDPVVANFLILFLCATDPALSTALTGQPLAHTDRDFPLRALTPSRTAALAAQLAALAPADLDNYLAHFAADPPPPESTRAAVRRLFAQLCAFYQAAAAQHLGLVALPE